MGGVKVEDLPGVEALQEPGRLPLSYICLPLDVVVDINNSIVFKIIYLFFIAVLVMSVLFYAFYLIEIFL